MFHTASLYFKLAESYTGVFFLFSSAYYQHALIYVTNLVVPTAMTVHNLGNLCDLEIVYCNFIIDMCQS